MPPRFVSYSFRFSQFGGISLYVTYQYPSLMDRPHTYLGEWVSLVTYTSKVLYKGNETHLCVSLPPDHFVVYMLTFMLIMFLFVSFNAVLPPATSLCCLLFFPSFYTPSDFFWSVTAPLLPRSDVSHKVYLAIYLVSPRVFLRLLCIFTPCLSKYFVTK